MGILMNLNIYAEKLKEKSKKQYVKKNSLEKTFSDYKNWLQKNNREDKAENYKYFLDINKNY